MPVAALVERDFKPGVLFTRSQQRYTLGGQLLAAIVNALQHAIEHA